MTRYQLVVGTFVALTILGALIRWFVGTLFPSEFQEREDEEAIEEAYGDASLLDRDRRSY